MLQRRSWQLQTSLMGSLINISSILGYPSGSKCKGPVVYPSSNRNQDSLLPSDGIVTSSGQKPCFPVPMMGGSNKHKDKAFLPVPMMWGSIDPTGTVQNFFSALMRGRIQGQVYIWQACCCWHRLLFTNAKEKQDIILIAADEEEHVTAKNSKQVVSPTCTKNRTRDLSRGFVLYLQ